MFTDNEMKFINDDKLQATYRKRLRWVLAHGVSKTEAIGVEEKYAYYANKVARGWCRITPHMSHHINHHIRLLKEAQAS